MNLVCLDLEGVLIPEIWIAVAQHTSLPDLKLTTRDISNYDELMKHRLDILHREHIDLGVIQTIISHMEPMDGAIDFLDKLRETTQLIILTDSFEQFISPFMKKLGYPTVFSNTLTMDKENRICGYTLRVPDGKTRTVQSLQQNGISILAAGDSYNDMGMIKTAHTGILFNAPKTITEENPDIPSLSTYSELLQHIKLFDQRKESLPDSTGKE